MSKFVQVQLVHFFQHDDTPSQPALDFATLFETKFPIGKLFYSVESNVICATANVLVSRTANCWTNTSTTYVGLTNSSSIALPSTVVLSKL